MPFDRNTWAIAFGLNARGATGIILAGVGLQTGVIDERVFVAIVVMALITSFIAGPAMNSLLRPLYGRLGPRSSSNEDVPGYPEDVGVTVPSIRRILIPVRPGRQLSDYLDAAVEPHLLEGLGRKLEVTLLAVGSDDDSEAMTQFVGTVRDRYPDRPIRTRVVVGTNPARAILAEAERHDLIIVGAPESETGGPIVESAEFGAPESLMLGPVIQEILLGAPCPTMVIWRHLMQREPRHILVPGDNTMRTQVATDLAFALAEGTGATVALLQVIQSPGHEPSLQAATAVADSALQLRRPGADFESQIISAEDPAVAIREAATDVEADLVILTTRTYREQNGHIVGPTAVDLLTNPPCPVALVHVPSV